MQIRPMTEKDCAKVAEIEAVSFSMPWSLQSFTETVSDSKYHFLVAEEQGEILGYCGFYSVVDEAEIPNVCVSPSARRRGIGRKLMEELICLATGLEIETMYLEVRKSNLPAQKLYQSLGFEEIGLRKNFYEQPREDAVLMCKKLQTSL